VCRKLTKGTPSVSAGAWVFRSCSVLGAGFLFLTFVAPVTVHAREVAEAAMTVQAVSEPVDVLTLEMMIEQGGPILWTIIGLGFITLVLALYLFLTVTPRREAPSKLLRRVSNLVRSGDVQGAMLLCENRDELISRVLLAGLKMADQERYIIQEAMDSEGDRGAAELWQRISYLNNIGVIAPLLGLLGTVWGMIGAFGAIALDNSQVKGLTMAYNVSQAMITTAAGLLLAIPALVMYYYLRGRVLRVVSQIEMQASEFVELLVRNRRA